MHIGGGRSNISTSCKYLKKNRNNGGKKKNYRGGWELGGKERGQKLSYQRAMDIHEKVWERSRPSMTAGVNHMGGVPQRSDPDLARSSLTLLTLINLRNSSLRTTEVKERLTRHKLLYQSKERIWQFSHKIYWSGGLLAKYIRYSLAFPNRQPKHDSMEREWGTSFHCMENGCSLLHFPYSCCLAGHKLFPPPPAANIFPSQEIQAQTFVKGHLCPVHSMDQWLAPFSSCGLDQLSSGPVWARLLLQYQWQGGFL